MGNSWPLAPTAWHLTWFSWLWNWLIHNTYITEKQVGTHEHLNFQIQVLPATFMWIPLVSEKLHLTLSMPAWLEIMKKFVNIHVLHVLIVSGDITDVRSKLAVVYMLYKLLLNVLLNIPHVTLLQVAPFHIDAWELLRCSTLKGVVSFCSHLRWLYFTSLLSNKCYLFLILTLLSLFLFLFGNSHAEVEIINELFFTPPIDFYTGVMHDVFIIDLCMHFVMPRRWWAISVKPHTKCPKLLADAEEKMRARLNN